MVNDFYHSISGWLIEFPGGAVPTNMNVDIVIHSGAASEPSRSLMGGRLVSIDSCSCLLGTIFVDKHLNFKSTNRSMFPISIVL